MADTIVYTDLVARDGVDVLLSEDPIIAIMNKRINKEFEQRTYNTGAIVKFRYQSQPALPTQSNVAAIDTIVQQEGSITAQIWNTTFLLGAIEEAYLLGGEDAVSQDIIIPAMKTMATQAAILSYYNIFSCPGFFGVPGSPLKTATDWGYGRAALRDQLSGASGLYAIMTNSNMAETAGDLAKAFNPSKESSTAFLDGVVKSASGLNFYDSSNLPTHTNGSAVGTGTSGCIIASNPASGATSVAVTGGTTSGTYKVNDVIFFSGIYEVQPHTKNTLPRLRTFSVTEDVTLSGGAGTIKVFPAIVGPENPKLQTCSALPTTANYVGRKGTASHTYEQAAVIKKETSFFCSLPLPDLIKAQNSMASYEGVKIYSSASSDITNRQNIIRGDMLVGVATGQWRQQYRAFTADLG